MSTRQLPAFGRRVGALLALLATVVGLLAATQQPASATDVDPIGLVALELTAGTLQVNAGAENEQAFDLSPSSTAACSDGVDNNDAPPIGDGHDGLVDYPADPQCSSPDDNSELVAGFQPLENVVVVANVAADGTMSIPKNVRTSEAQARASGGIYFPPGYLPDATLGTITARFQPAPGSNVNTPATGTINIDTGAVSMSVPVRIKLEGGSGLTALGDNCFIPSGNNGIALDFITGTTSPAAPNTPITGVPYNRNNGKVTVVNNSFAVNGAGTCALLGLANDSINTAFGLPAPAGRNSATFTYRLNPRLNYTAASPVANAGPDQFRHLDGSTVTLDGSASADANEDPLTYAWTQTAGTPVTLTGADTAHPTFTGLTSDDTLSFQLEVSSANGYGCPPTCDVTSSTDTVDVVFATNVTPVADAGPDQTTISVGTTVTLDGSASSDANLDTLGYAWVQTAGDPVTLTGADTAHPSFTAPASGPADFEFQLTVDDTYPSGTNSDTVAVHVIANQAPDASAGPDQTGKGTGQTVTLTAAGSTDADGHNLTYEWNQIGGHAVTLSDSTAVSPTFVVPAASDFVYPHTIDFQVTVNDGFGGTDTDTVSIQVQRTNPTVTAVTRTPSGTVFTGDTVTLGANVNNPDGGDLAYTWSQVTGHTTSLSATNVANPTYVVPVGSSATSACTSGTGATSPTGANCPRFQVTVTNTSTGSAASPLVALAAYGSTLPGRPVANAGADQYVKIDGGTVTLDGSASTQAQGHTLTYAWTQTGGTAVTLDGANTAHPSFEAPGDVGDLTFSLTVTDPQNPVTTGGNANTSVPDTVVVRVTPDAVVANAGPDQAGKTAGQTVTLDGSLSTEPDHGALTYSWVQTDGPAVTLSDASAVKPTFVAPAVTTPEGYTITFDLTVTNGGPDETDTSTDSVSIAVVRSTPTVTVSRAPSGTVFTGDVVTLTANITNPDGTNPADYTYTWAQITGHTTALSSTTATNPTYSVPVGSSATSACTSGTGGISPTSANCPRYSVVVTNVHTGAVSAVANLGTYSSTLPGRPTANAGPDQTVAVDSTVTLAGSGTQAQGRALTYAWTQTAGPVVTLSDATAASPTFTAPASATSLTFSLVTTDPLNPVTSGNNQKTSNPDTVIVTVADNPTISGTVTDPEVAPVEGVVVSAFAPSDGDEPTATATTGADGIYTLTVPPGTYAISFVPPTGGLAEQWYSNQPSRAQADLVPVAAGNVIVAVDAHLGYPGRPTADAGEDQEVVAGAGVTLHGSGTQAQGRELTYAWTQTGGTTVVLDGADTATPTFTAPAAPDLLTFELVTTDPSNPILTGDHQQASEADSVTVTVVPAPNPSISGTVVDGNGDPIEGAFVAAYAPTDGFDSTASTLTGPDGTYDLVVPDGSYAVVFMSPAGGDYITEWYDDVATRANAQLLAVSQGNDLDGIDAALELGGSIAGTVTDPNGDPVEGAAVHAFLPSDVFLGSVITTTAADGTYTLHGLRTADHRVAVVPPVDSGLVIQWFDGVGSRADATDVTVGQGDEVTGIDVQLAAGGTISGTVVDSDGNPIAGVAVHAVAPTDTWVPTGTAVTAADGTYVMSGLPVGSYKVHFVPAPSSGFVAEWHQDAATIAAATAVTVTAGATEQVDAELVGGTTISGTVLDENGNPVAGVFVEAFSPTDSWLGSFWAVTGADGTYTLTVSAPGTYRVSFRPPAGFDREWFDSSSTRHDAVEITANPGESVTGIDATLIPTGG